MDIIQNNNDEVQHRLPLGLFKQAIMKLDSFMSDVREIREDDDISDDERAVLDGIISTSLFNYQNMINIVASEIDEEEFIAEDIAMDEIGAFPGDDSEDLLESEIN